MSGWLWWWGVGGGGGTSTAREQSLLRVSPIPFAKLMKVLSGLTWAERQDVGRALGGHCWSGTRSTGGWRRRSRRCVFPLTRITRSIGGLFHGAVAVCFLVVAAHCLCGQRVPRVPAEAGLGGCRKGPPFAHRGVPACPMNRLPPPALSCQAPMRGTRGRSGWATANPRHKIAKAALW